VYVVVDSHKPMLL